MCPLSYISLDTNRLGCNRFERNAVIYMFRQCRKMKILFTSESLCLYFGSNASFSSNFRIHLEHFGDMFCVSKSISFQEQFVESYHCSRTFPASPTSYVGMLAMIRPHLQNGGGVWRLASLCVFLAGSRTQKLSCVSFVH